MVWVMADSITIISFIPLSWGIFDRRGVVRVEKEQKSNLRIVEKTIKETKETVLELRDSVDPVSTASSSLEKLDSFLEEMQQEVSEELSRKVRKTSVEILADFFATKLQAPIKKLLFRAWANAVLVAREILRWN